MRAHRSRSRRATAARVVWARPTTRPPPPVPFKGQAGPRFGGLGLCGRGRSFCSSLRPSRRGQRDPLPHGDLPQVPARWAGPQLRVSGVSAALGRGARGDSGLCRELPSAAALLGVSAADPRRELRAAPVALSCALGEAVQKWKFVVCQAARVAAGAWKSALENPTVFLWYVREFSKKIALVRRLVVWVKGCSFSLDWKSRRGFFCLGEVLSRFHA